MKFHHFQGAKTMFGSTSLALPVIVFVTFFFSVAFVYLQFDPSLTPPYFQFVSKISSHSLSHTLVWGREQVERSPNEFENTLTLDNLIDAHEHEDNVRDTEKDIEQWSGYGGTRKTDYRTSMSRKKILFAHVPKSGGTSICNEMKKHSPYDFHNFPMGQKNSNCWTEIDEPLHYFNFNVRDQTCNERKRHVRYPFSMTERFMDSNQWRNETLFCEEIRYGIVVRNPLARAVSHIHFFMSIGHDRWWPTRNVSEENVIKVLDKLDKCIEFGLEKNISAIYHKIGTKSMWQTRSLNYLTSNYLYRFLLGTQLINISGSEKDINIGRKITGLPISKLDNRRVRIEQAKETLRNFDFVLTEKDLDSRCGVQVLKHYLNLDTKSISAGGRKHEVIEEQEKKRKRLEELLRDRNQIDLELYEYAQKLSNQLCEAIV